MASAPGFQKHPDYRLDLEPNDARVRVVTGDLVIMGQTVDISGEVHDTVRVWTQGLTITGTIDGDSMSGSFATDFGDFPATAERSTE